MSEITKKEYEDSVKLIAKAKNIIEAYETQEEWGYAEKELQRELAADTGEIEGIKLPMYARVGGTEMRWRGKEYYRDAGCWGVEYKVKDGQLVVDEPYEGPTHNFNEQKIIEITYEEWKESNKGYINDDFLTI